MALAFRCLSQLIFTCCPLNVRALSTAAWLPSPSLPTPMPLLTQCGWFSCLLCSLTPLPAVGLSVRLGEPFGDCWAALGYLASVQVGGYCTSWRKAGCRQALFAQHLLLWRQWAMAGRQRHPEFFVTLRPGQTLPP